MEESIKMDKIKLITMSPLVLAYLGDTVYESYIREHLIRQNINRKVNNLHKYMREEKETLEYIIQKGIEIIERDM